MHYQTFLTYCTEKELFAFIEANMVALYTEDGPDDWINETKQMVKNAIAHTCRFGVRTPIINNRASESFWEWYSNLLHNWWVHLSDNDVIAMLRKMPWNNDKVS